MARAYIFYAVVCRDPVFSGYVFHANDYKNYEIDFYFKS